MVFGGIVQFLLILFFLPETMRPPQKILVREPSNGAVREQTKWEVFKIYAFEPLKLLRLLRYPPVFLAITYAAVVFGTLVLDQSNNLTTVLLEHLHNILIFSRSLQLLIYHHWVHPLTPGIANTDSFISGIVSGISQVQ